VTNQSVPLGAPAIPSSRINLHGPAPKTRVLDVLLYKKIVPITADFVDPTMFFGLDLSR
jgi:hypothetical protein